LYLNKIKIQKNIKQFKHRSFNKNIFNKSYFSYKNIFIFKNKVSFVFNKFSLFLELKVYKFFIRKLRRLTKKRKFKSFVNICCNHCFSRKSKNSRMGKGKGKFVRFVYRSISLKPIFSFIKLSKTRLFKFTMYLNKKTKNKFLCV
jgi:hypothetical protein